MKEIVPEHRSGVYLLCATQKVAGRSRHYLGGSQDVAWRVKRHKQGNAASFTKAVLEQGGLLRLARVWYVPLEQVWPLEKRIKARKNAYRLCPYCYERYERNGVNLLTEGGDNEYISANTPEDTWQEYPLLD